MIAGDDNVEGFGYLKQLDSLLNDGKFQNSEEAQKYAHLRDPQTKQWAERKDVFVVYEHERHKQLQGTLNMRDYGGIFNETFGPEVEFGHVMGNAFDEPVIIVKAGWTGKSLGHDFLSPSANGFTGFEWVRMVDAVKHAIENADKIVGDRAYRNGRAELAGVVWWHGYSDLVHSHFRDSYQTNLHHLVRDLRRAFHIPYLPIVVGELGGSGINANDWEMEIRDEQKAVCTMTGNRTTVFVETAKFVHKEQPRLENNVRYYGRGDTMIEVANAFAVELLDIIYRHDEFGETDTEMEAEFETDEEDEEFSAVMVMIFVIGLCVLGAAFVQRHRSGYKESLSEIMKDYLWRLVRLFRHHDDVRLQKQNQHKEKDAEIEFVGFDSLPSSDSPLYELDEISSNEGDGDHTFA